jgi:hypothetical protein
MTPSHCAPSATTRAACRPATRRDLGDHRQLVGTVVRADAMRSHRRLAGIPCGPAPLRIAPVEVDAAHAGLRREGHERGVRLGVRRREAERSLASTTIERPSGVSSASDASCAASASSASVTPPGTGMNSVAMAVAEA